MFDTLIPAFNKIYPKIKINHVQIDVDSKLPPTLATGVDVPDGAFYEDINIVQEAVHFKDLRPWKEPYISRIEPFKVTTYSLDGKLVAVPWDTDPMMLWYNKTITDKAGVDPEAIKSYDDLLTAAKTIKEKVKGATAPIHIDGNSGNIQLQAGRGVGEQVAR